MNYKGFYHTFLLITFQTCDWRSQKEKVLQLMCIVETSGEEWLALTAPNFKMLYKNPHVNATLISVVILLLQKRCFCFKSFDIRFNAKLLFLLHLVLKILSSFPGEFRATHVEVWFFSSSLLNSLNCAQSKVTAFVWL